MPTGTRAKLWRELVAEAGDEAIDRAESVGRADAERELAAAGFDVARENAKADALIDSLVGASTNGKAASLAGGVATTDSEADSVADPAGWVMKAEPARPPRPASRWGLLLAATLAAAATGGVLYALGHRSKPVDVPEPAPHDTPTVKTSAPKAPDVPSVEPVDSFGPGLKPGDVPTPPAGRQKKPPQ